MGQLMSRAGPSEKVAVRNASAVVLVFAVLKLLRMLRHRGRPAKRIEAPSGDAPEIRGNWLGEFDEAVRTALAALRHAVVSATLACTVRHCMANVVSRAWYVALCIRSLSDLGWKSPHRCVWDSSHMQPGAR